jgi:hypothetical protein
MPDRHRRASPNDGQKIAPPTWNIRHTELLERVLANTCELCSSTVDIEVHHIRHLKDLQRKGRGELPAWVQKMASRHRKTLVVCSHCHHTIHGGRGVGVSQSQSHHGSSH